MYRVRFHLANGPHFMHWQIKDMETGNVEYVNPDKKSLYLIGCKLRNSPSTAKKIFETGDKTVCAWIECKSWHTQTLAWSEDMINSGVQWLEYNPHKKPHWNLSGENIDGYRYSMLMTHNKKVYQIFN